MSDSEQILEGTAARTPTDEQLNEYSRLHANAIAARAAYQAAKREYSIATAQLAAHVANAFEGESVAA